MGWVKRLIHRIKRVIRWVPIIYSSGDWDFTYLYPLMSQKLKEIKQRMIDYPEFVGVEKDLRDISVCIELLDRFSDGYPLTHPRLSSLDKELERLCTKHNMNWFADYNKLHQIPEYRNKSDLNTKIFKRWLEHEETMYKLMMKMFLKHRNWWI